MAGEGDEENLCEVQENEVEALKAIYGTDCSDLREGDVWKKRRPPELLLRLLPENSTQGHIESHVSVCLHIVTDQTYPLKQPALSLKEPKGLSEAKQQELLVRLKELATSLEGGEMIYELAVEVGAFLAKHNSKGFCSMAEEMEVRRRQEEEKREEGVMLMEDIKRKELVKSVEERRKEIAEEQAQVKKEEALALSRMRTTSEGVAGEGGRNKTCSVSSDKNVPSVEIVLNISGQKEVVVLQGAVMGTNSLGQATHTAFCPTTSQLLALSTWKLPKCSKVLQVAMEQELSGMARLPPHPNIVPCVGLGWKQEGEQANVHLAHELVRAPSLSALYLSQGNSPSLDLLRSICQGVLAALAHLHASDMVHRDLRDSSIFLEPGGRARVADAGLDWRLREAFVEGNTGAELNKERLPAAPGRRGKKADVWRLGAIALSLTQGVLVQEHHPNIPTSLPSSFQDFLTHCLDRDERNRWSATALLEHPWLKELLPHKTLPRPPRSPSPPPAPPPLVTGPSSQGQSRLEQEFRIQFWIGKGAFGDVCKVQNLLDDQEYAIKRIRLNPADKATTKKIMREVKLLSRLNHENVVRYYNSWRELTTTSADETTETETSSGTTPTSGGPLHQSKTTSLKGFGPRSFLPPATPEEVSVDWSVSWLPQDSPSDNESSSDDSDEDDGPGMKREDSSGLVVFGSKSHAHAEKSELWEEEEGGSTETESASSAAGPRLKHLHYMYIQMEYCDKQTLRSCIDTQKLHLDMVKVWRMFREIVEGLVHIHTQGIIHRDLKPVNIFIDSCDHVKIGDFGLATSGLLGREEELLAPKSSEQQQGDELTGQIGTALYVAPELLGSRVTSYNQKVDLYSLGVIFFEMCSPPPATAMERGKLLGKLRSPNVELPSTWDDDNLPQQTYILKWLLSHQPSDRPTSQELAQSDWLPPAQVEEHQMQQLVRNTMKNPRAPAYRRLMDACLTQSVPHAKDVYYDSDLAKPSSSLTAAAEEVVRNALSIFATHGAVRVEAPMLLPRTENSILVRDSKAVTVMTRGGDTVTLPFDLRVAYARQVARLGIENQRRYSINKVLREEKVFGLHPKEGTECAFDIVGSPSSAAAAAADAEVLLVASEVVLASSCWQDARLYFRLSHAALAAGCFEQAGVNSEQSHQVRELVRNCPRGQVSTRLAALGLSDQAVISLVPLLEAELPLEQLSGLLRVVTRRPGESAERVKAALAELRRIESAARGLGLALDVVYCVRPAPLQYSGLLIQLVREKVGKGGTRKWDELAAGGRYDNLVANFAETFRLANTEENVSPGATGISLSVDKVAATLAKSDGWQPGICQVVVGGDQEEACKLARELWNAGVSSRLEQTTRGDVLLEHGKEMAASMVIVCTSGGGGLIAQADRSWQERKVTAGGSGLARWGLVVMESKVACLLDKPGETGLREKEDRVAMHKGETGGNPVVNYNFTFLDRERYSQSKKKLEVRKSEKLAAALARFDPSTAVEVIAIGLPDSTLRAMANTLELDDEERMARSLEDLCGQYPRHRKELRAIAEEMLRVRLGPKAPIIVLYSLEETHKFRIMC